MVLYLSIIGIALLIIFLTNMTLSLTGWLNISVMYAFLATMIYFLIMFAIDALIAILVRISPKKWYNPENKIYKTHQFEKRLYLNLQVKKWKDHIPELGRLANFSKTKIESNETEYLYKFASETCYAEVMHIISALASFLMLIISQKVALLTIVLPILLVNLFLQIPPIIVQRFNRPKLLILYQRSKRKTTSIKDE